MEAEGDYQFLARGLHDLADGSDPTPQGLGPYLTGIALGWADEPRPVMKQPSLAIFGSLEALVDHVRSRGGTPHTPKSSVRLSPPGKESLGQRLIFSGSRGEAEAGDYSSGIAADKQAESFVPSQAVGPSDVGLSGQPPFTPSLRVMDGHRGAVQGFVGTSLSTQKRRQVQSGLLDELQPKPHQPVKLRAVGQGWKGVASNVDSHQALLRTLIHTKRLSVHRVCVARALGKLN